nr:MAG TPA: hypothetical protein [Caudoviricetes sp.]
MWTAFFYQASKCILRFTRQVPYPLRVLSSYIRLCVQTGGVLGVFFGYEKLLKISRIFDNLDE